MTLIEKLMKEQFSIKEEDTFYSITLKLSGEHPIEIWRAVSYEDANKIVNFLSSFKFKNIAGTVKPELKINEI